MTPNPLRSRIADQFSYRSERADIWRAFDLVLETDAYLNLGYSESYQPHPVGSSQRRLVRQVGDRLSALRGETRGASLLDVGCGRGGPARQLASEYGFDVTGVDLVPYNVRRAFDTADRLSDSPSFLVGDATRLPVRSKSFAAATAIDALVYLSERDRVVSQIADALEPGGVFVLTDLVRREPLFEPESERVQAFADGWDMPLPGTVQDYVEAIRQTTLECRTVEDISSHSVRRFRRWTTLFLWLVESPVGPLLEAGLERSGLDPEAIVDQVRRAHRALPALGHILVVARLPSD